MLACEFLHCTLTELRKRIENPADYFTILAYLSEQGERINNPSGSNSPPVKGGSIVRPPRR